MVVVLPFCPTETSIVFIRFSFSIQCRPFTRFFEDTPRFSAPSLYISFSHGRTHGFHQKYPSFIKSKEVSFSFLEGRLKVLLCVRRTRPFLYLSIGPMDHGRSFRSSVREEAWMQRKKKGEIAKKAGYLKASAIPSPLTSKFLHSLLSLSPCTPFTVFFQHLSTENSLTFPLLSCKRDMLTIKCRCPAAAAAASKEAGLRQKK